MAAVVGLLLARRACATGRPLSPAGAGDVGQTAAAGGWLAGNARSGSGSTSTTLTSFLARCVHRREACGRGEVRAACSACDKGLIRRATLAPQVYDFYLGKGLFCILLARALNLVWVASLKVAILQKASADLCARAFVSPSSARSASSSSSRPSSSAASTMGRLPPARGSASSGRSMRSLCPAAHHRASHSRHLRWTPSAHPG